MTSDIGTGWRFEVSCRTPPLPARPGVALRDDCLEATRGRYDDFLTLDADTCVWTADRTVLAGTIDDLGYHDSADALASFTFRLLRWALTCGFGIPEDVYPPLDDVSLSIHKLT